MGEGSRGVFFFATRFLLSRHQSGRLPSVMFAVGEVSDGQQTLWCSIGSLSSSSVSQGSVPTHPATKLFEMRTSSLLRFRFLQRLPPSLLAEPSNCSRVSHQRSNNQRIARTDTRVLTNKHLNIPFCDLSIFGYSGKTADAAPFTTLSPENRFVLSGIDGAVAPYPPAVQR
jgi:hypothetical protein